MRFRNDVGITTLSAYISTPSQNENGGARGVMVIVVGYGHGDTTPILGQD